MEAQLVQPMTRTRVPLSALTKWTMAGLLGTTLAFIYGQAFILHAFQMPGMIVCIFSLGMAAVVATGWRWAPLLGLVAGVWLTLGTLDHILVEVAQPNETHLFAWMVVRVMISFIGAIAGVAATVQNYRHGASHPTPRWFAFSLVALAALSIGAILVAAIPQTTSTVGVSPDISTTAPTITLNDFSGGTVRVTAGEVVAVQLDALGVAGHTFDVDALNIHTPMPGNGVSLAVFKAPQPGTYTFYCAPHYNKATGEGMHGTLIVEP